MHPRDDLQKEADKLMFTIGALLKYKAIIVVDDPVQLAGALYSNSVVMMPWPPISTTWLMEDLLQPWVHFVPLKNSLSDVATRMEWVLSHPDEAQTMTERAREWVHMLYMDETSVYMNRQVIDRIVGRYRAFFQHQEADIVTIKNETKWETIIVDKRYITSIF